MIKAVEKLFQIPFGQNYLIYLNINVENKVQFKFSFLHYDFGICIVQRTSKSKYYRQELIFTNQHTKPLT